MLLIALWSRSAPGGIPRATGLSEPAPAERCARSPDELDTQLQGTPLIVLRCVYAHVLPPEPVPIKKCKKFVHEPGLGFLAGSGISGISYPSCTGAPVACGLSLPTSLTSYLDLDGCSHYAFWSPGGTTSNARSVVCAPGRHPRRLWSVTGGRGSPNLVRWCGRVVHARPGPLAPCRRLA